MSELVDKANKLLRESLESNKVSTMAQLMELQQREHKRHHDTLKQIAKVAETIESATIAQELTNALKSLREGY